MASSQPAIATLVVGASIVLLGMAVGALARNGRSFELVLLAVGYGGMQGAALLNVIVAPADTLRWRLLALPVALAMLLLALCGAAPSRWGESDSVSDRRQMPGRRW